MRPERMGGNGGHFHTALARSRGKLEVGRRDDSAISSKAHSMSARGIKYDELSPV